MVFLRHTSAGMQFPDGTLAAGGMTSVEAVGGTDVGLGVLPLSRTHLDWFQPAAWTTGTLRSLSWFQVPLLLSLLLAP